MLLAILFIYMYVHDIRFIEIFELNSYLINYRLKPVNTLIFLAILCLLYVLAIFLYINSVVG